jgi:hypothetical protein
MFQVSLTKIIHILFSGMPKHQTSITQYFQPTLKQPRRHGSKQTNQRQKEHQTQIPEFFKPSSKQPKKLKIKSTPPKNQHQTSIRDFLKPINNDGSNKTFMGVSTSTTSCSFNKNKKQKTKNSS